MRHLALGRPERHLLGLVVRRLLEGILVGVVVEALGVTLHQEAEVLVGLSVVVEEEGLVQQVLDEETQALAVARRLSTNLTRLLVVDHRHLDLAAPSPKHRLLRFDRPAMPPQLHTHALSASQTVKLCQTPRQAPKQLDVLQSQLSPPQQSVVFTPLSPTYPQSSRVDKKPNPSSTTRSSISWRTRRRS